MEKVPSLVVSAVSTWDGKALTKGQKQLAGFEKGVKNLAAAFGITFGAAAMLSYGKNAVKAFAENEKSAKRLEMVLKNIGLGFDTAAIEKNLGDISAKFGYEGEVLREAFQKLITVTGDTAKAQDLLNLSLDVSAGSGEDLLTVNQDLAAALVGNTKGLKKYNLGLTQGELSALDFNDAVVLLTKTFAGAGEQELTTYTGKMRVLKEAAESAKEEIGRGLLSAITSLAGSEDNLDPLIDKMNKLSVATGDFIALLFGGKTKDGYSLKDALDIVFTGGVKGFGNRSLSAGNQDTQRADAAAAAKAAAEAARREKERLALLKKAALVEKNKLSLSKAAAVFDTQRISLAAALRATYDKETILRLEALQAIEEDNGELALKKISELAALQKNADLAKLAGIKEISNETLAALNNQLLNELFVIDKSKMAENDKELKREEAFKKYNAAIVAAGQLAAKESYDEGVRIQLTQIAQLASLSKTTSAAQTAALLREQAELSMIDRVAAAQKKADDARLAALKTYLALLTGGDLAADPNFAKASPEAQKEVIDATKAAIDALTPELIDPATSDALKAADAVLALAASITPRGTLSSYKQAELDSAVMLNSVGGGGSSRNNVYNLNFTTGVISQPDEFATLLQDTIQKLNRGGDPLTVAGVL
jgi:hypothetical protein